MGKAVVDDAVLIFDAAKKNIIRDVQMRTDAQFLEHNADALAQRVRGAVDFCRNAVDDDLAAIGLMDPVEGLDQRRLSCAVLSHKRVYLARFQIDGKSIQRLYAGKGLRNISHF